MISAARSLLHILALLLWWWLTYGQIYYVHRKPAGQKCESVYNPSDWTDRWKFAFILAVILFHFGYFFRMAIRLYTTTNFTYKTELISQSLNNAFTHQNKWRMRKKREGEGCLFFFLLQMESKIFDIHLINFFKILLEYPLSIPTHN